MPFQVKRLNTCFHWACQKVEAILSEGGGFEAGKTKQCHAMLQE